MPDEKSSAKAAASRKEPGKRREKRKRAIVDSPADVGTTGRRKSQRIQTRSAIANESAQQIEVAGYVAPEGVPMKRTGRKTLDRQTRNSLLVTDSPKSTNDVTDHTHSFTHHDTNQTILYQEYKPTQSPGSKPVPPMVFTHSAGGKLSSPAVVNFCTGYSTLRPLFLFQGSMNIASRVNGFHACVKHLDLCLPDTLLLGGRSMGARAAVIAANEQLAAAERIFSSMQAPTEVDRKLQNKPVDLVLVSYPLKGPKDIRDKILLNLPSQVNVLFVIGERDAMCPYQMLADVREKMKAQSWLVVVQGMDHGMHGKGEKELGEWSGKVAAEWAGGERGAKLRMLDLKSLDAQLWSKDTLAIPLEEWAS